MFILSKVLKNKGQKIFKIQKRKNNEELTNILNFNNIDAYKRYKEKKNTQISSYNDFYGSNVDQKFRFDNILENKQFSKVKKF